VLCREHGGVGVLPTSAFPLNQTLHGGDADAGDLQYKYILCPHTIFHVTTDSSGTMSNPLTLPPQLLEVHGDGVDPDV
jgi:hypothetical protein